MFEVVQLDGFCPADDSFELSLPPPYFEEVLFSDSDK